MVAERLHFEAPEAVLEKIEWDGSLSKWIEAYRLQDLSPAEELPRLYCAAKRFFDVVLSCLALAVLAVPMLVLALAIYIDDPGRVLFTQKRVGRGGRRFRFYKFRTMRADTPHYCPTMELDDPERYMTRLGRFLRRFSLDELPQLLNVLRGDMSLVGPRPLISDEYKVHSVRAYFGVYNVRPGITGLAQINGRDFCPDGEKVRWDVKYLEDFGLWQDLRILLSTVPKVFGAAGVADGRDTPNGGGDAA